MLVGFDSAWTPSNAGAIVAVLRDEDGTYRELAEPTRVSYPEAEHTLLRWQAELSPAATIVFLDQPTIVRNAVGQRPVENIVASPVSLRYGGVQPANTSRDEMFGADAPIWRFLSRFGGIPDPLAPGNGTRVFETFPVLQLIALGWTLPDKRATGRLPKYNPKRRKTFLQADWRHVCAHLANALRGYDLVRLSRWADLAGQNPHPAKADQDGIDACLCLLGALALVEQRDCLMIGNLESGYIIIPYGEALHRELEQRCTATGRVIADWVRSFRLQTCA